MLVDYLTGSLFVFGHGPLALFNRLYPQRLQGKLYLQVEVALAADIAGAAEGTSVERLKEFVGIFHPPLQNRQPDSHLAVGAVGIEDIAGGAGASGAEINAGHIDVVHPVAPLALDALAHIVFKIIQVGYIQTYLAFEHLYPP